MLTVEGTAITLTRGDTLNLTVQIKNKSDNTPYIPIESDTITFYLKRNIPLYKKNTYVYESQLIAKPIPYDTMVLHLDSDDTKNLILNKYLYDIVLVHSGNVDTVINNADFTLV